MTWHLNARLDRLYESCYQCMVHQKLPQIKIKNESKTEAQHPHRSSHADVIKRATQNILNVTNSKKADNLRDGLIILTSAMKHSGPIEITVDNAPGFTSQS